MHVQPLPPDPYAAAQLRAAVELEIPIVRGTLMITTMDQAIALRDRTRAILADENVLIRHDAPEDIATLHLQARAARQL